MREQIETVVIGGGQAGLSVGYHLQKQGREFVILDANERIGDSWRKRWDSLRLFTPARYDGLAGMPFPAPPHVFPTKDEMADYLEAYAQRFKLPVRTGVRVERLSKQGSRFVVAASNVQFEADNVVVAMSNWQSPRLPSFARDLAPGIVQMHSSAYRNPSQLQDGGVLIVGAGNSGAEIAVEVARSHPTWLSGPDTGKLPFKIDGISARLLVPLVLRFLFHRVLTIKTPLGRKVRAKVISHGMLLLRIKPKQLAAAGVARLPRTVGARDGLPVLADDRTLDVANVIWCTGFDPGFSWIDLPIFGKEVFGKEGFGEKGPMHKRGVVANEPGLYFVGLTFLYAASSSQVHGVGRDAAFIADQIAARMRLEQRVPEGQVASLPV